MRSSLFCARERVLDLEDLAKHISEDSISKDAVLEKNGVGAVDGKDSSRSTTICRPAGSRSDK